MWRVCKRWVKGVDTITKTNRFAAPRNQIFVLSKAHLNTFYAILMITGYHSLPHTRLYCEKKDDVGIPLVYIATSRKSFENIKQYINFAGN